MEHSAEWRFCRHLHCSQTRQCLSESRPRDGAVVPIGKTAVAEITINPTSTFFYDRAALVCATIDKRWKLCRPAPLGQMRRHLNQQHPCISMFAFLNGH